MNDPQFNFPTQSLLIGHDIEGKSIHQRPMDGYINATEVCKVAGKKLNDYLRLNTTQQFLEEMSNVTGIPVTGIPVTEQNQSFTPLIYMIQGGKPQEQGTWIHPKIAINLGQWLSPKFAVWVVDIVDEWRTGQTQSYMPPHVKRYMKNKSKIPPTHFSMLNETYIELLAPIDDAGIRIPVKMTPDISTGRMFSGYLRENGFNPDDMPHYEHEFTDGRQSVRARLYPIELLSDFKIWLHNEWLPKKAKSYFQERLPQAIPHIQHLLGQSNNAGRPPRIIEGIDDSPEEVAKAIMQSPPKGDWGYKSD